MPDSPNQPWKPAWHQRFGPIAWVRNRLRNGLFRLVRRILETDDGRAMSASALKGLLRWQPELPNWDLDSIPPAYSDLARDQPALETGRPAGAVFITGRFRSGSTLLWNLFRNVEGVTAYYEPLNERRWFDPRTRGDRIDATHRFVKDYWKEYDGLDVLGEYYQESWTRRNLYMDASFWEPVLKRYIDILIEKAPGRPVLKFNRVDFRLPWLRRQFPAASIIHVYRHPRDLWCSSLMDIRCFPKDGPMTAFGPHDKFYLLTWAGDLTCHFPFLDENTVRHPYQLSYYIWKLSYLFGRQYAHYSLAFEDLVADPAATLVELFRVAGIPNCQPDKLVGLVDRPALAKWKAYADHDWFSRHELECDNVLREFFRQDPAGSGATHPDRPSNSPNGPFPVGKGQAVR